VKLLLGQCASDLAFAGHCVHLQITVTYWEWKKHQHEQITGVAVMENVNKLQQLARDGGIESRDDQVLNLRREKLDILDSRRFQLHAFFQRLRT